MRKYQIEEEIFQLKIIFHIILHFGLFTISISCHVGDLLTQKLGRCALPSHLPYFFLSQILLL